MQSVDFSELNTSMYNTQIKKQKIPSPQGVPCMLLSGYSPRSPLV